MNTGLVLVSVHNSVQVVPMRACTTASAVLIPGSRRGVRHARWRELGLACTV